MEGGGSVLPPEVNGPQHPTDVLWLAELPPTGSQMKTGRVHNCWVFALPPSFSPKSDAAGCDLACYFQTKPIWPGAVFDPAFKSSPDRPTRRDGLGRSRAARAIRSQSSFQSRPPAGCRRLDDQPAMTVACIHPPPPRPRPFERQPWADLSTLAGSRIFHVSTGSAVRQCPLCSQSRTTTSAKRRRSPATSSG